MKTLRLFGLLPLLGLACSSSDDGGGSGGSGGGGSGFQAKAAAVCERQVADGCQESSFCEERLVDDHARAVVFGCTAELDAYADCLAANTWTCTPLSGGGQQISEPDECDAQESAFDACQPSCSWAIIGETQCEMSCPIDGQDIGFECPSGPASCTCTVGPKAGTAFQLTSCETGELAKAILETCS